MKKKLILLACSILAFIALMLGVALREPSLGPDIELVRGVRPFSYKIEEDGQLERVYVLRMPFKVALKRLNKELDKSRWGGEYSLMAAAYTNMYTSRKEKTEIIQVDRCLRLPGIVKPKGSWERKWKGSDIYIVNPDPDPRGFVVVTTTRPMAGLTSILSQLRSWIGHPLQGGPTEFTELVPELSRPIRRDLNAPDIEPYECTIDWVSESSGLPIDLAAIPIKTSR